MNPPAPEGADRADRVQPGLLTCFFTYFFIDYAGLDWRKANNSRLRVVFLKLGARVPDCLDKQGFTFSQAKFASGNRSPFVPYQGSAALHEWRKQAVVDFAALLRQSQIFLDISWQTHGVPRKPFS